MDDKNEKINQNEMGQVIIIIIIDTFLIPLEKFFCGQAAPLRVRVFVS